MVKSQIGRIQCQVCNWTGMISECGETPLVDKDTGEDVILLYSCPTHYCEEILIGIQGSLILRHENVKMLDHDKHDFP